MYKITYIKYMRLAWVCNTRPATSREPDPDHPLAHPEAVHHTSTQQGGPPNDNQINFISWDSYSFMYLNLNMNLNMYTYMVIYVCMCVRKKNNYILCMGHIYND